MSIHLPQKQIQPVLVRGWAVHSFWAYCLRVQMFLGDNTDEHTTADVQNSSSSTTQRADKPKRRTMTVKSSISGVAWRDEYRARSEDLVTHVNEITTHTYAFARFIFLHKINGDKQKERSDLAKWVTSKFAELWQSLTLRKAHKPKSSETERYRKLIEWYLKSYFQNSGYTRRAIENCQQISLYEGKRISTSYLNSVQNCFGNRLRYVINRILNVKERLKSVTEELQKQGKSQIEIKKELYERVTNLLTMLNKPLLLVEIAKLSLQTKSMALDWNFMICSSLLILMVTSLRRIPSITTRSQGRKFICWPT